MPEQGADRRATAVIRPCPGRARAWWGDLLLAESGRAVRVDAPGRHPSLWFPVEDVRLDLLVAGGSEPWDGGDADRFDAEGPVPDRPGPVGWGDRPEVRDDGVGVARRWTRPPAGLEALAGLVTVDHDRALVEVVDGADADDPRDVTVKRFPNWGDAADLVAVLLGGRALADHDRPVVEGSQLLGQSVVAAMHRVPGRRLVSGHLSFLMTADATRAVDVDLDELSAGRTFTSLAVRATQGDRLCAAGTLLLGVPSADVVEHAVGIDGVPGPYDAVPYDMGVTGRDLRVVDAAYTDDPAAPVGPPSIDAWVRFRDVGDDPAVHAGLLAQFTGHMSIAAALRPHAGVGQREAHRSLSTAINAIAVSFHADVRMDRWVLYRHRSTVVAGGMAHSECRVHDEAGVLLASFSVDAMVRPMAPRSDHRSPDARTAL